MTVPLVVFSIQYVPREQMQNLAIKGGQTNFSVKLEIATFSLAKLQYQISEQNMLNSFLSRTKFCLITHMFCTVKLSLASGSLQ